MDKYKVYYFTDDRKGEMKKNFIEKEEKMVQFCFDCMRDILKIEADKKDLIITENFYLCEGCSDMKQAVVRYKKFYRLRGKIRKIFFKNT